MIDYRGMWEKIYLVGIASETQTKLQAEFHVFPEVFIISGPDHFEISPPLGRGVRGRDQPFFNGFSAPKRF